MLQHVQTTHKLWHHYLFLYLSPRSQSYIFVVADEIRNIKNRVHSEMGKIQQIHILGYGLLLSDV